MSWERVEQLPGARSGGGAFREGAEPVVAKRGGLSAKERLRLFWWSTPDRPADRTAKRVLVTPNHVYVERVDGSRARVGLERLRGQRLEKGWLIYGVLDDEDLLLTYRPKCEVQDRLTAVVLGDERLEPWRESRGLVTAVLLGLALFGLGMGLLATYPIEGALEHIDRGMYTAEAALGTYGGFAAIAVALLVFLFGPSRWRVDAVGVSRTRGVVPWMSFTVPPERFRRVALRPAYHKPKNRPRYHSGWWVDLELRAPTRVGTLSRTTRVSLGWFSFALGKRTAGERARCEREARALAERLRTLLALEDTAVAEVRP